MELHSAHVQTTADSSSPRLNSPSMPAQAGLLSTCTPSGHITLSRSHTHPHAHHTPTTPTLPPPPRTHTNTHAHTHTSSPLPPSVLGFVFFSFCFSHSSVSPVLLTPLLEPLRSEE